MGKSKKRKSSTSVEDKSQEDDGNKFIRQHETDLDSLHNVSLEDRIRLAFKRRLFTEFFELFLKEELVNIERFTDPERVAFQDAFEGISTKQAENCVNLLFSSFEAKDDHHNSVLGLLLFDFVTAVNFTKGKNALFVFLTQADVLLKDRYNNKTINTELISWIDKVEESVYLTKSFLATYCCSALPRFETTDDDNAEDCLLTNYNFSSKKALLTWVVFQLNEKHQRSYLFFKAVKKLLLDLQPFPTLACDARDELEFWIQLLSNVSSLIPFVSEYPGLLQHFSDCLFASSASSELCFSQFLLSDTLWEIKQMHRFLIHTWLVNFAQSIEESMGSESSLSMWIEKFTVCLDQPAEKVLTVWQKIVEKYLMYMSVNQNYFTGHTTVAVQKAESLMMLLNRWPLLFLDDKIKFALFGALLIFVSNLANLDIVVMGTTEVWLSALKSFDCFTGLSCRALLHIKDANQLIFPMLKKCQEIKEFNLLQHTFVCGLGFCQDLKSVMLFGKQILAESLQQQLKKINTNEVVSLLKILANFVSKLAVVCTHSEKEPEENEVADLLILCEQFLNKLNTENINGCRKISVSEACSFFCALKSTYFSAQALSKGKRSFDNLFDSLKWALEEFCIAEEDCAQAENLSECLLSLYKSQCMKHRKRKLCVNFSMGWSFITMRSLMECSMDKTISGFVSQFVTCVDTYRSLDKTIIKWLIVCPKKDMQLLLDSTSVNDCDSCVRWCKLRKFLVIATKSKHFLLDKEQLLTSDLIEGFMILAVNFSQFSVDSRFVLTCFELFSEVLAADSKLLYTMDVNRCIGFYLTLASLVSFSSHMPLSSYLDLFNGCRTLLNDCLKHQASITVSMVPSFLAVFRKLLYSVGNRLVADKENLDVYIRCCHLLTRLVTFLCSHKLEINKVATYLVADFLTVFIQVSGLNVEVKKALVPAVYNLLDLCDNHGVSLLSTNLEPSLRETFRVIYENYVKFYKYTGFI